MTSLNKVKAIDYIKERIRERDCVVPVRECMLCHRQLYLFITSDEKVYFSPKCSCIDGYPPFEKRPIEFLQQILDNKKQGDKNDVTSKEKK